MPARRVLVVHTVADIRDLLDLLLQEQGYEVEVAASFASVPERLKQQGREDWPALIVLEVNSAFPQSVELLDRLRTDPDLRAIPILALVLSEGDAVLARASLNVFEVLMLLFEPDVLIKKVEQVILLRRLPPLPPSNQIGPSVLAVASELLVREQRALIIRWAQRVAIEGPYPEGRARPSERLGQMPLLINALLAAWRPDTPSLRDLFRPDTELWLAVSEHVRNRQRIGARAADIVGEYLLLRDEIWRTFRERLPDLPTQDVYLLEEKANRTLDELISLTLEAYEEQVRRQAA